MGSLLGQKDNNYNDHDLGASAGDIAKDVGTFAISPIAFGFRKLGIFGNNRGSKRDKRDRFRDALYDIGINRSALGHVHSDDWEELKKLGMFLEENGQPGLEYLNENLERAFGGTYGPTAQQVISGFSSWKRRNYPQQPQPSGPSNNGSQTNTSNTPNSSPNNTPESGNNSSPNSGVPAATNQQSGFIGNNATTYALVGGGGLLLILATIALTK